MKKGQKSSRGGYQDLLCPFTEVYVTQWDGGNFTHKGTKAYDIRGVNSGVKYAYYAPCDVKCVKTIPSYGQAIWQSTNKVRFANGVIDYCTLTTVHDDTFNAKVGQVIKQGVQLGNMGTKGYATGVHCHIEIAKGKKNNIYKNKYGNYIFTPYEDEVLPKDAFFMDNTVLKNWKNPKYLKDVKVNETIYKTTTPSEGLNMRDKSNLKGKILYTLKKGTKVEYIKDVGTFDHYVWSLIKYNKKVGYVAKKYLK